MVAVAVIVILVVVGGMVTITRFSPSFQVRGLKKHSDPAVASKAEQVDLKICPGEAEEEIRRRHLHLSSHLLVLVWFVELRIKS
jgi:hypothetical protein